MKVRRSWQLGILASLCLAVTASAEVRWPAGTTPEEIWRSPARIDPDVAARVIAGHFLSTVPAPDGTGDEVLRFENEVLDSKEIEAVKFFLASDRAARRETVDPETGNVRGEATLKMGDTRGGWTPAHSAFADRLARIVVDRLGIPNGFRPRAPYMGPLVASLGSVTSNGIEPMPLFRVADQYPETPPCFDLDTEFLHIKYVYDVGWDIDIRGMAVLGLNIEYAKHGTDALYVLYPFGYSMSLWDGLRCVYDHKGLPATQDDIESCGNRRVWQLLGDTEATLSILTNSVKAGNAYVSPTYLGASTTGTESSATIKNHFQKWPADGSCNTHPEFASNSWWPSLCWGYSYGGSPGVAFQWLFDKVVSWYPNVILNSAQAFDNPSKGVAFEVMGMAEGNPHRLSGGWPRRSYGHVRAHPLISCTA